MLLLLIKKTIGAPYDEVSFELANAASLKHDILYCSIFPRFGNFNGTLSDFHLRI